MSCAVTAPLPATQVYAMAYRQAQSIARRYGVDNPARMAQVATGIAMIESSLRPRMCNKVSSARGLMQIILSTQRWLEGKVGLRHDPNRVFDPEQALLLGQEYMGILWKKYRDWEKVVQAYHDGHYPSEEEWKTATRESREYVPRWRAAMQKLTAAGAFGANVTAATSSTTGSSRSSGSSGGPGDSISPLLIVALAIGAGMIYAKIS